MDRRSYGMSCRGGSQRALAGIAATTGYFQTGTTVTYPNNPGTLTLTYDGQVNEKSSYTTSVDNITVAFFADYKRGKQRGARGARFKNTGAAAGAMGSRKSGEGKTGYSFSMPCYGPTFGL